MGRNPKQHVCGLKGTEVCVCVCKPGADSCVGAGAPVTYQLWLSVAQGKSWEALLECLSFPLKVKIEESKAGGCREEDL